VHFVFLNGKKNDNIVVDEYKTLAAAVVQKGFSGGKWPGK